jgi:hypothetical protein
MAVTTVKHLIENLLKNYDPKEPIAYTIYSEADIIDLVDEGTSTKTWAELVNQVGGAIEYFQSEINQLISTEYLKGEDNE